MLAEKVNDVFDWLPLAALIENRILAMHGGIGKHLSTVAQLQEVVRCGPRPKPTPRAANHCNIRQDAF
jgi:diadenosine tetraphosphatase ApaH/serine/threonine PP2A family protein phosphatase